MSHRKALVSSFEGQYQPNTRGPGTKVRLVALQGKVQELRSGLVQDHGTKKSGSQVSPQSTVRYRTVISAQGIKIPKRVQET